MSSYFVEVIIIIWGIISILGMLIAFIPCLGILNWINIPSSTLGLIVNIIVLSGNSTGTYSEILLILFLIPIILGSIRLVLGCFVL